MILNGDDALLRNLEEYPVQPITWFGTDPACNVYATDIVQGEQLSFTVHAGGSVFPVRMNVEGAHYVPDAMAAVTIGLTMGVMPENIAAGLEQFRNMAGRQEVIQARGVTILKDCYNAGPESMEAALKVLGSKSVRRIAVLGDMLELGTCTQAEHYRVGRIAAEKADIVLAYGPNASRVVGGCLTGGMTEKTAQAFTEIDQITAALERLVKPGDYILVKGSHGMHMEQILDAFLKNEK